jgi:hypothetical protein
VLKQTYSPVHFSGKLIREIHWRGVPPHTLESKPKPYGIANKIASQRKSPKKNKYFEKK